MIRCDRSGGAPLERSENGDEIATDEALHTCRAEVEAEAEADVAQPTFAPYCPLPNREPARTDRPEQEVHIDKFVVVYSGGMGMAMDPAVREKVMGEWGAWYGQIGANVVDGGAPFGASKHFSGADTAAADGPMSTAQAPGYTVIQAADLDAATAACADHPHLKHGGQVSVFQYIDMQG